MTSAATVRTPSRLSVSCASVLVSELGPFSIETIHCHAAWLHKPRISGPSFDDRPSAVPYTCYELFTALFLLSFCYRLCVCFQADFFYSFSFPRRLCIFMPHFSTNHCFVLSKLTEPSVFTFFIILFFFCRSYFVNDSASRQINNT